MDNETLEIMQSHANATPDIELAKTLARISAGFIQSHENVSRLLQKNDALIKQLNESEARNEKLREQIRQMEGADNEAR